jgi:hypothetical protein
MINRGKILADRQGRQFADVLGDPQAPVQELLDVVNGARTRLSDFTVHASLPGLAAVVRELEQKDKVKTFFKSHSRHGSKRFRQLTGVVIRIKMEEEHCGRTGTKGYVEKLSHWYIKAEIYQPKPSHPNYTIWKLAQ